MAASSELSAGVQLLPKGAGRADLGGVSGGLSVGQGGGDLRQSGIGGVRGPSPNDRPSKPSKALLNSLDLWSEVSLAVTDVLSRHDISTCIEFRKLFDGSEDGDSLLAGEMGLSGEFRKLSVEGLRTPKG